MRNLIGSFLLGLALSVTTAHGQNQEKQQPPQETGDVVRISTELVQTDAMVFDRQGRFVEGLKPEQFQLRVDGKPIAISFFERIVAGSPNEATQLAKVHASPEKATARQSNATVRGRTIIFFIDDLHLSADSVERTRKSILNFIDKEMGAEDQAVIASATGQIGFLQQLTNNKAVLRAAIARLNHRPYVIRDNENVPMTEYLAIKIMQGDRDAIGYFVTQLQQGSESPTGVGGGIGPPSGGSGITGARAAQNRMGQATATRQRYEMQVKRRADLIVKQSTHVTSSTLSTLESLMRSTAQLPGRKLVFFISDGFYLMDNISGSGDRLRRITDAATRSGVVIYSLDARGMVSMTDAASNRADPSGQLSRSNIGELSASQDALNALAGDTGGKALLNSGALQTAVSNALKETSNYYLLAWRPESEEQKRAGFKRIDVSIANHPEWTVRLPRGYFTGALPSDAPDSKKADLPGTEQPSTAKSIGTDMRKALTAFAPRYSLPTQLAVSYLDVPDKGVVVSAAMQTSASALSYGADGKQTATVDIAGVVLNDQGKQVGNFQTRLNVSPLSSDPTQPDTSNVVYNYRAPVAPGLYQVRVAARDEKSGRVGSAMQWIEIPDLTKRRLTLSSLLVGGQVSGGNQKDTAGPQFQPSVDRRFRRSSHLSFWVFVYNAARGSGGAGTADVMAQVQILRDGREIVTTPQRKLKTEGMTDLARIPYGGDFALSPLPPGRYVLQVTITDRSANLSASERLSFDVE